MRTFKEAIQHANIHYTRVCKRVTGKKRNTTEEKNEATHDFTYVSN